jgi:hypothetical protein
MGFIVWAWRDSREYTSRVSTPRLMVANLQNGAVLFWRDRPDWKVVRDRSRVAFPAMTPAPFVMHSADSRLRELAEDGRSHQSFAAAELTGLLGTSWWIFIPHWLSLLTVAALWLVLLFWRARHRKPAIAP